MREIQYEDLMQIVKAEKKVMTSDAESVIGYLVEKEEALDEDFEEINYENSARKKLWDMAKLFEDADIKIYGTADNYHNVAVEYARQDMYDCACMILERGIENIPYSVDLLADLVTYRLSLGQYNLCEEPYITLESIPKISWNWRAFSFSIDYQIERANHIMAESERETAKQKALDLANQFIERIGSDQAYYDKSVVLRTYGEIISGDNVENEESVLRCALEQIKVAPKCALRLSDILFDRGEFEEAISFLERCCLNVFRPQPDINGSYSFLLLALSKASELFGESQDGDYSNKTDFINEMYRDFHTAIRNGLRAVLLHTANKAIKTIEAQTGIEYPYMDVNGEDSYEL